MNLITKTLVLGTLGLSLCACGNGKSSMVATAPMNTEPTASAAQYTADADGSLSGLLMGTDMEKDPLLFTLGTAPQYGAVTLNTSGSFVYTPMAEVTGEDHFSFTVSDGKLKSKPAQVVITISPVAANFSLYSRQAFSQAATAQPMPLNTRDLAMDVIEESAFDDLLMTP
jgi:Bacterial Ig domain